MIAPIRSASSSAVRRAAAAVPRRCASPALARRSYASGAHQGEKQQQSSDVPWAISSLVVFGGLGIYLTAPPKDGHGHGGHDSHAKKPRVSDDKSAGLDFEELAKGKTESKDQHEDAPAGNKRLAELSHTAEDEPASRQKAKQTDVRETHKDDHVFKTGVAAVKEGHRGGEDSHITDPKKTVAAAKTSRQDAKAKAEFGADENDAAKGDDSEEKDE
ncbi:hypothetical protein IE81DRAFT_364114 [Ceraceosorus guamensis]|uniref:Uncharacterized protein n=1 Tax=Ceraceosorus guamensis TaxID=1522189 RepID=A0A316W6G6_9BASI|nr:hypothetical protein IE81DRAFT_364114 [Ceraceosorus guamensis]PWN45479.1 hypothetical protein IE81DRAFT_364114 [Ceraceosorus guamensis]